MTPKAFATVLRRLRIRRGLSQEAFGFEAGIHRTYVSQLERGLKSPSLKILDQISDVLGVRPSKLIALVEAESKKVSGGHGKAPSRLIRGHHP